MTEHSAEVMAGARAMYEALPEFSVHEAGYYYWPDLTKDDRDDYCQAFAAGLAEYQRLACNGGDE